MNPHQHGKGVTGCSCGKNSKGQWSHMYAYSGNKLQMTGYRKCPDGYRQPKNACSNTCEKIPTCEEGFEPTNGLNIAENYCNHQKHGVVCRKTDGSGNWMPPAGCTKSHTFPFAVGTNGKPCRTSCPCREGFTPSNGKDGVPKGENHCGNKVHGVVCRKMDGSGHWVPPLGCTKERSFPFAAKQGTKEPCQVGCPKIGWNLLKKNTQGNGVSITDKFIPFKTRAIRIQRSGAIKHGWFRATEIDAFDKNGKQIKPAGARTDNWYGGWRKSNIAPELFDDSTRWGDNTGVHFQNHATVWFDEEVEIRSLKFVQIGYGGKYNQDNWQWEKYVGDFNYFDGFKPPAGWKALKLNMNDKNDQDVRDEFKPFTTKAIRVQKTGPIVKGWFRVTEIDAFGVDGKQITPISARTDNYYGGWRKSAWAPELYDDSTRWGKGTGVHFQNHATLTFAAPVVVKSLRMVQIGYGGKYNQANWMWMTEDKSYDVNCVGSYGEFGECSSSCTGGFQTRIYKIFTTAKFLGKQCAAANGEADARKCNSHIKCEVPEPIEIKIAVPKEFEATKSNIKALKNKIAAQLGVSPEDVEIKVGGSRRLIEGQLMLTVTVTVFASKAGAIEANLESPAFAKQTGTTFISAAPAPGTDSDFAKRWTTQVEKAQRENHFMKLGVASDRHYVPSEVKKCCADACSTEACQKGCKHWIATSSLNWDSKNRNVLSKQCKTHCTRNANGKVTTGLVAATAKVAASEERGCHSGCLTYEQCSYN